MMNLLRTPISVASRKKSYIKSSDGDYLNFSSNDYLGLAQNREVLNELCKCIKKNGAASSASRLLTGNNKNLELAEDTYAKYFGYESALFFPSGYQANTALVSTLFNEDDSIIFDKRVHASIAHGLKGTTAEIYGYNHSSYKHLEKRVKTSKPSSFLITESLFSMDGDILNVSKIEKLKKEYCFNVIVDEAHSFGALGEGGRGIATGVADIAIGTMGKAFGFNGAFVLMPSILKDYFLNFSSPLIYTTALPPYYGPIAEVLLEKVESMDSERAYIKDLAEYTKNEIKKNGLKVSGDAHIVSISIGDEGKAIDLSCKLLKKGIILSVCRFPTVPLGKAILRLGITASLAKSSIDYLVNCLKEVAFG